MLLNMHARTRLRAVRLGQANLTALLTLGPDVEQTYTTIDTDGHSCVKLVRKHTSLARARASLVQGYERRPHAC